MDTFDIHDSTTVERDGILSYIRLCALVTASLEMFIGALLMTSNLAIFTYYLADANNGNSLKKPDFFFENVIELNLLVSAKTLSKIAAFMFVYSVIHFLASIFLFQGAKLYSHEKCRWSFIIHVCLWTCNVVIVMLAPLNDKIFSWLFIIVFALKIAELALIKRLMDELHIEGFNR